MVLLLGLLSACAHGLPQGAVPAAAGGAGDISAGGPVLLCDVGDRRGPEALEVLARSLQKGVELDAATFAGLFPNVGLDRAFVARVQVRAPETRLCGPVLWARELTAEPRDGQGAPVEAAIVTKVPPGPVLAVSPDGVAVSPPPVWRITGRAQLTRYGWVPVAGVPAAGGAATGVEGASR
jgi:hypothetical protein